MYTKCIQKYSGGVFTFSLFEIYDSDALALGRRFKHGSGSNVLIYTDLLPQSTLLTVCSCNGGKTELLNKYFFLKAPCMDLYKP